MFDDEEGSWDEWEALFVFDDGDVFWSGCHLTKEMALDEKPTGSDLVELRKRTITTTRWEIVQP